MLSYDRFSCKLPYNFKTLLNSTWPNYALIWIIWRPLSEENVWVLLRLYKIFTMKTKEWGKIIKDKRCFSQMKCTERVSIQREREKDEYAARFYLNQWDIINYFIWKRGLFIVNKRHGSYFTACATLLHFLMCVFTFRWLPNLISLSTGWSQ
jgi:hypothetical protein